MKAGRELDALVWEKVCGGIAHHYHGGWPFDAAGLPIPKLSTDVAEAWSFVERFGFMVHPCALGPDGKPAGYWVGYPRDGHTGLVGDVENETVAFGDTAPHAICLAALKAVEALARTEG